MSLLRHRLITAYKLIEHDAIEPNELGWLVHHYWNGHTYQVIMSWRLYAKHGDAFDCNCADRRITAGIQFEGGTPKFQKLTENCYIMDSSSNSLLSDLIIKLTKDRIGDEYFLEVQKVVDMDKAFLILAHLKY